MKFDDDDEELIIANHYQLPVKRGEAKSLFDFINFWQPHVLGIAHRGGRLQVREHRDCGLLHPEQDETGREGERHRSLAGRQVDNPAEKRPGGFRFDAGHSDSPAGPGPVLRLAVVQPSGHRPGGGERRAGPGIQGGRRQQAAHSDGSDTRAARRGRPAGGRGRVRPAA
ncbi:hypothetical protein AVEN_91431-1, partial [Araneus ventricosus]